MTLPLGARLGAYEVNGVLGAGGMGEVYRARDTKLDRDVALKILPEAVAGDAERLMRFRREAKTLAALNHPHIAQIYGLEDGNGTLALAMELVEGEDLAARVRRGPVPLDEAIVIARQIAEALDAAHTAGIVHRDLKPANVIVRADGVAKVLDFGLAKASEPTAHDGNLSHSPTVAVSSPTQAGIILGTAAYMSPEQARGKTVDKRTDVWAFGCVLYELLTGRPVFAGDTVTDVLGAIVRAEPDWSALPPETPESIRRLLRRCLAKDRAKRLPDIVAALLELDDATVDSAPASTATGGSGIRARRLATVVPWVAALTMTALLVWQRSAGSAGQEDSAPHGTLPVQFSIDTNVEGVQGAPIPQFAISPDGTRIVFVGVSNGVTGLWLRDLADSRVNAVPNTNGAAAPFWSPDSKSVGFFAGGRLRTSSVVGGPGVDVCAATPESRGGTWSIGGDIVFSDGTVLQRVRASGGTPSPVTTIDTASGETNHRWPQFFRDGRRILYWSGRSGRSAVAVVSLDKPGATVLLEDTSRAEFTGGDLVYARNGTLMVQALDQTTLELASTATPVAQVGETGHQGHAPFTATDNALAFIEGGVGDIAELTWYDRTGSKVGSLGEPDHYTSGFISPDGTRVAASIQAAMRNRDIWIIDVIRGTRERLTNSPASELGAVWSPDGRQVGYGRIGSNAFFVKPVAGGPERQVAALPYVRGSVNSFSPDGKQLLVRAGPTAGRGNLWIVPLSGGEPSRFIAGDHDDAGGVFSPDGRWVAYISDESGRREVQIRSLSSGTTVLVSRGGGSEPSWRGDGRELFYLGVDGSIMAAPINAGADTISVGEPVRLFGIDPPRQGERAFDVSRDGKRFLVITRPQGRTPPMTVTLNWRAALK